MVALVLLPGMDGTGSLFSDFRSMLGTQSVVIAYPPDRPLDYAQLQELVRSSLPAERPFVLLAESFSGPTAISLAANPPPQLTAVVLVCTFARLPLGALPSWLKRIGASIPWWRIPVSIVSRFLLGRFASASSV